MNVLILGQEKTWIHKLSKLCKQDEIYFYEKENPTLDLQLVVTDFPLENARKGILSKIPFLVVSKEAREEKILQAFALGAEDYMIYPVSPQIARRRILRILKWYQADFWGDMQSKLHLTPNEGRLLAYMMQHPGKVFSRSELIVGAFSENYEGYDRNVDNYMKQIRRKLADSCGKQVWIETVHGVGYRYRKEK